MRGPMGGRNGAKPKVKVESPMKTLKRLLGIIFKKYKIQMIIVFVLIFVSVIANVQGTLFIQTLIDDYITPMLQSGSHDFGPLLMAIGRVAIFYLVGVASTYAYARIMVYVTQGTMLNLRNEIFSHMESLPIKYFDTHAHGDIMSVYTNDVDTLRQMISQSLPQLFSSVITIISVLVSMISLDLPLTGVTLLMVAIMIFVTKKLAGKSSNYFLAQQIDLGKENGYIEEMMNGQKVVKVFNHEKQSIEDFRELNDKLYKSSYNANKFANILMPINAQIGNVSYVVCAIVGGVLALSGLTGLTLGKLVSFLSFNKSFSQPISQISQQFNSVVMALAGAERVFMLLDEKPEEDNGYVTLVNVQRRTANSLKQILVRDFGHGNILIRQQARWSTKNSEASLLWMMSISVIRTTKWYFTMSPFMLSRVKRLRLSVLRVQVKQPLQTLLTDSMTFRTVKFVTTASILIRLKNPTCAVRSVLYFRRPICLRAQ